MSIVSVLVSGVMTMVRNINEGDNCCGNVKTKNKKSMVPVINSIKVGVIKKIYLKNSREVSFVFYLPSL